MLEVSRINSVTMMYLEGVIFRLILEYDVYRIMAPLVINTAVPCAIEELRHKYIKATPSGK